MDRQVYGLMNDVGHNIISPFWSIIEKFNLHAVKLYENTEQRKYGFQLIGRLMTEIFQLLLHTLETWTRVWVYCIWCQRTSSQTQLKISYCYTWVETYWINVPYLIKLFNMFLEESFGFLIQAITQWLWTGNTQSIHICTFC